MVERESTFVEIPEEFWTFVEKEKSVTEKKHLVTKEKNENSNLDPSLRKEDSYFQGKFDEVTKLFEANHEDIKKYLRVWLKEYATSSSSGFIEFPPSLDGNLRKVIHDVCDEVDLTHESVGKNRNRKLVVGKKNAGKKVKQEDDKTKNTNLAPVANVQQDSSKMSIEATIQEKQRLEEESWKSANKDNQPSLSITEQKALLLQDFKDIPDPIMKVSFRNLRNRSVDVEFDAPDENGYPITQYALYLYNSSQADWAEYARSEKNRFSINDLEKNTVYKIRIGAFNELGESELDHSFKFRTPDTYGGSAIMSGSNYYGDFPVDVFGNEEIAENAEFLSS